MRVTVKSPPMLPALQTINLPGTGVGVAASPTANDGVDGTFADGLTGESEHAARTATPNEAPIMSAAFRFMRMSLPSLVCS